MTDQMNLFDKSPEKKPNREDPFIRNGLTFGDEIRMRHLANYGSYDEYRDDTWGRESRREAEDTAFDASVRRR